MTNKQSTSKLDNFKDLVEIGRGGFGVVYSAARENGEKVALKKIDRQVARDRVRTEIISMRSLKHRNIVEFYEDFMESNETYVVMELCEYGSLRAWVKNRGALEEKVAAHVLRQLIAAVTYMHRNGFVHRDLSAGNVFIKALRGKNLIVKLGDFGLTTNLKRGETACTIVGTPGYIAPQVYNQDYDQAADVYSLGGVLFTMLTARDPPTKGDMNMDGLTMSSVSLIQDMRRNNVRERIKLSEIQQSDFMKDTGENGQSREFSTDRRLMSRERVRRSNDNISRSREGSQQPIERISVRRAASQPPIRIEQRIEPSRPPSTRHTRSAHGENWPLNLERLGGHRVKTPGGRYIVETGHRARFEVAAKNEMVARVIVVERIDSDRHPQKVYVHTFADRRERCREEKEELIMLTTSPSVFTSYSELPREVANDYNRLVNIIMTLIRGRVIKIILRRPPQFPESAAQLMENGDLRIKFSRSIICRKVENGEIYETTNGRRESVRGTNLTKVNEVYHYLVRFETCLAGMGNFACFPCVFTYGPDVVNNFNNTTSIIPSATTSTSRLPFSNISNMTSQVPRSAPLELNRRSNHNTPLVSTATTSSANNDENRRTIPKFRLKCDNQGRYIGITMQDGRSLRQSSKDVCVFIFTDPAIRPDEKRFRKSDKIPDRAAELYQYLLPKLQFT